MRARSTARLVRWALTVALASPPGGCTPQKPPAPPPAPSPSPTVPPEETFALSQLHFHYEEGEPSGGSTFGLLKVSYGVLNQLDRHASAGLCFDLIDKDGYFISQGNLIDWVGLRARDSEPLVEDASALTSDTWAETELLRFYLSKDCSPERKELRSAVLYTDKSGRIPPPEARVEGKLSAVHNEDISPLWFELKQARLVQNELGEVWVSYTLTNLTRGRASATLCARLTSATQCSCQSLDQAEGEELNLGLGVSTRKTSLLNLRDNAHWGQGQQVQLYLATFGCSTPAEQANSNVLTLAKPRSIGAPPPPEPPESPDD